MAFDNFDRADAANLGALWTNAVASNAALIRTNAAAPDTTQNEAAAFYNAVTFSNDHYSQGQITAVANGSYIGVAGRVRAVGSGYWYGYYGDGNGSYLISFVNGAWTSLASGAAFTVGLWIRIEVEGDQIRAYRGTSPATLVLTHTVTDTAITTGAPGVLSWATGIDSRLNDVTILDLSTPANVSISTLSATGSTPAPTVAGAAAVPAALLSATASAFDVTVSVAGGVDVSIPVLTANASTLAPAVAGAAAVSVPVLSATGSTPAPPVAAAAVVSLAVLPVTGTVVAPNAPGSSIVQAA